MDAIQVGINCFFGCFQICKLESSTTPAHKKAVPFPGETPDALRRGHRPLLHGAAKVSVKRPHTTRPPAWPCPDLARPCVAWCLWLPCGPRCPGLPVHSGVSARPAGGRGAISQVTRVRLQKAGLAVGSADHGSSPQTPQAGRRCAASSRHGPAAWLREETPGTCWGTW